MSGAFRRLNEMGRACDNRDGTYRRLLDHVTRHHTFTLSPTPPFRLDLTAWAIRRRADNAVDRWDGETYQRTLTVAGRGLDVAVRQAGPPDDPSLTVTLEGARAGERAETAARATLGRLLGLWVDLSDFYRRAAQDPQLGPLAERFRGLKPPRFPTVFETLVNAIACQQVTLTLGIRLLNRLAACYGISGRDERQHAFPEPSALASTSVEALRASGFSQQKARALIELAATLAREPDHLDNLAAIDNATAVEQLRRWRGVGRWTAEYVLLRGLGRLDVFPGDDVGARNNLQRWLRLDQPLDYQGVAQVVRRWQPYAGLVYFHLLLDRLAAEGLVS